MPLREPELYLHEELLLLALRDEEGTVHHWAGMVSYALAGGILSELLLAKRISVAEDKKKLVEVESARLLRDELLDECLTRISEASRRGRLGAWLCRLAQTKKLRHRVAVSLCRKGVLRESEDKVLWIFTRKIYPERDPRCERALIERLRKAVFRDTRDVDPRTAVLVSLAHATGLLAIPFSRRDLRGRKKRIEQICQGELMGKAAREVIQAAQAAVAVATTVATTAAITAATS